jgi:hypothetical protein
MKVEIYGQPQFIVVMSKPLFKALEELSSQHYDAHCRSYSRKPDGFLTTKIATMSHLDISNYSVTLSFRELDTLAKISEGTSMFHALSMTDVAEVLEFASTAQMAMESANQQSRLWRCEVELQRKPDAIVQVQQVDVPATIDVQINSAYNDMYHKVPAEVSHDAFSRIYRFLVKRFMGD